MERIDEEQLLELFTDLMVLVLLNLKYVPRKNLLRLMKELSLTLLSIDPS